MDLTYQFESKSKYTYKKKVGSGGSAEVFLYSRQTEGLPNQDVALKVLKSMDQASVRELLNEGRRLGMLRHPNILTTFGYEKIDDEKFGLVLEYFPGENLKRIIPRIEPEQRGVIAEYIIKTLCEAMALAHSQDVIHGDLSARNVLVSQQGQVKLSDFGLACRSQAKERICGPLKGSADYMAPELWEGVLPSRSSDIFSLGVLALEILRGHNLLQSGIEVFLKKRDWDDLPLWRGFFEGCFQSEALKRESAFNLLSLVPHSGTHNTEAQTILSGLVKNEGFLDRTKTQTQILVNWRPLFSWKMLSVFVGATLLLAVVPRAIGLDESQTGRLKPCLLTLTSQPWGEIFIDGVSQGYSPFVNFPISPGTHKVEWRNPKTGRIQKTLSAFENGTLAYKVYVDHGTLRVAPLKSGSLLQKF